MNARTGFILHVVGSFVVTMGLVWLAGIIGSDAPLRTVPLVIAASFGVAWGVDQILQDLQQRMRARQSRAAAPGDTPSLPASVAGMESVNIRGMDDEDIQALVIARSIRTGRSTHARVDRERGTLWMCDAGPGVHLHDDLARNAHLN